MASLHCSPKDLPTSIIVVDALDESHRGKEFLEELLRDTANVQNDIKKWKYSRMSLNWHYCHSGRANSSSMQRLL
jgi:hypothetical protein